MIVKPFDIKDSQDSARVRDESFYVNRESRILSGKSKGTQMGEEGEEPSMDTNYAERGKA